MPDQQAAAHSQREWVARSLALISLLSVFAYVVWQRVAFLNESPFPLGIDGYYYTAEVRSVTETGLPTSSSPVTFYLLAPFAWLWGDIDGTKLGAAMLGAAAMFPAYGAIVLLTRRRVLGLVAATVIAASHGSFYLAIEFVKNGVGVTMAFTAFWLALRASNEPSRRRIALAAIAVVIAALTHKVAAPIAVALSIPALVVAARQRWLWSSHRREWLIVITCVVLAAVTLLAVIVGRFGTSLQSEPFGYAPALVLAKDTLDGNFEAFKGMLVAVAAACSLLLLRRYSGHTSRERAMLFACTIPLIVFALIVWNPWLNVIDPQGLGFRLRTMAFVPITFLLPLLVHNLSLRVPRLVQTAMAAGFAIAVALLIPTRIDHGVIRPHPAMVSAVVGLRDEIPRDKIVIVPERHIAFMVHWYTRAEVRLRPDGIPAKQRLRLVTLAFIGRGSPIEAAIDAARTTPEVPPPLGVHPMHKNGLVLIDEVTWQWIIRQLPGPAREYAEKWHTI